MVGREVIKALVCPEGQRGSDSICILEVEGSETKCGPPTP